MSKTQMLRTLIDERLTSTAVEVFEILGRTIVEYEEELSISKLEIDRQCRLLLDVSLLKPHIKVENNTGDLIVIQMSKIQMLRRVINERLTWAAGEIFEMFGRTREEYEEELSISKLEIDRQRRLLDVSLNPQLENIVFPEEQERTSSLNQQHQERSSSLDQQHQERSSSLNQQHHERSSSLDQEQQERSSSLDQEQQERSSSLDQEQQERSSSLDQEQQEVLQIKEEQEELQPVEKEGEQQEDNSILFTFYKTTGVTTSPQSSGTQLSAAERQRRYRARRDADGQRRQQYLEKEKERWRKDVETGKKKKQKDLSVKAQRVQRKKWREARKKKRHEGFNSQTRTATGLSTWDFEAT